MSSSTTEYEVPNVPHVVEHRRGMIRRQLKDKNSRLWQIIRMSVSKIRDDNARRLIIEMLDKMVERSDEILRDKSRKIVVVPKESKVGDKAVKWLLVDITSAEGAKPRKPGRQLTLDGRVVDTREIIATTQPESYQVIVSPYSLKCTCPNALFTAAKAEANLKLLIEELRRSGILKYTVRRVPSSEELARYTLCKHTLLGLAIAADYNILDDKWIDTIAKSLVVIYLANGGRNISVLKDVGLVE